MPYDMNGDLVSSSLYAAKLGAVRSAENWGTHHVQLVGVPQLGAEADDW